MKKTPMGMAGLRKKWRQSTQNEIKRLKLPLPDHEYGYSWPTLQGGLSAAEYTAFAKWMNGQTQMVDEKLGTIAYTHDVIRGVDFIRHGRPTYWD